MDQFFLINVKLQEPGRPLIFYKDINPEDVKSAPIPDAICVFVRNAKCLTFNGNNRKIIDISELEWSRAAGWDVKIDNPRRTGGSELVSVPVPIDTHELRIYKKGRTEISSRIEIGKQAKVSVVIGRDSTECQIVIEGPDVSRCHAKITRDGDDFIVSDLGSTNGTRVNGQTFVNGRKLQHLDRVGIGGNEIEYYSWSAQLKAVQHLPSLSTPPAPAPAANHNIKNPPTARIIDKAGEGPAAPSSKINTSDPHAHEDATIPVWVKVIILLVVAAVLLSLAYMYFPMFSAGK